MRNEDILPVGSDPKRITRRLQVSAAGSSPMNDRKTTGIMAAIRTTDIWNANSNASRPEPLSRKYEDDIDIPVNDEDNNS